ncbi:hypothetical protein EIP91_009211 [Steccherinum ochraceum]|uniref:F-box domain-containing protein n=1 Tax=Steccherinum ochraceum TaxID=92696 RepID=A0A4R0RTP6_9APHY|nr:hypothetical protein EIP91_009211 [Steccherinum ochraceum]
MSSNANTVSGGESHATGRTMFPALVGQKLPWDVLLHILPQLDQTSEQFCLLVTCRTLYQHGIRVVLGGELSFSFAEPDQLLSFCNFVVGDALRGSYVRHLELDDDMLRRERHGFFWYPDRILLLATTLRQCTNLHTLHVPRAEVVFSFEALASALLSLKKLKVVDFGEINSRHDAEQPLMQMRFPLTSVALRYDLNIQENPLTDPLLIVWNFRSTLTNLTIYFPRILGILSSPTNRFEHIHTLEVYASQDHDIQDMDFPVFAAAFPNLEVFKWGPHLDHCDMDPAKAEAMHQRFVPVLGDDGRRPPVAWPSLKRLVCPASRAYSMPNMASAIQLWEGAVVKNERGVEHLRSSLQELTPESLELAFWLCGPGRRHGMQSYLDVFPEVQVPNLHMTFMAIQCDPDMSGFVKDVQSLRPRLVDVKFCSNREAALTGLHGLDVEAYAAEMFRSPELELAILRFPHGEHSDAVFQRIPDATGNNLEGGYKRLDGERAFDVMAETESQLSTRTRPFR